MKNNKKTKRSKKIVKKILPSDLTYLNVDDLSPKEYKSLQIYEKLTLSASFSGSINNFKIPVKEVVISSEIWCLRFRAFANCCYLEKITFKGESIVIGESTFRDCRNLKEVELEGSVKYIFGLAFQGCINLKGVTFKKGCEEIWNDVFKGCDKLETINIPGTTTVSEAFRGVNEWRNKFVNLGLPSKTLWTRQRCSVRHNYNRWFSFWPSIWNLEELLEYCVKEQHEGYAVYKSIINGEEIKITNQAWDEAYQKCLYIYSI